jgi:hypothetical protein
VFTEKGKEFVFNLSPVPIYKEATIKTIGSPTELLVPAQAQFLSDIFILTLSLYKRKFFKQ